MSLPDEEDDMARILYADDNEDLRGSFERVAKLLKHDMVAVDDAAGAWERLNRDEKFDLIISDLEMPQMDGLTFLKKVRSDDRTKDVRFALISGREKAPDNRPLSDVCAEHGAVFRCKSDIIIFDFIPELLALSR